MSLPKMKSLRVASAAMAAAPWHAVEPVMWSSLISTTQSLMLTVSPTSTKR